MSNKVYKVEPNYCNCHPETCNCDNWLITKNGERYTTIFSEDKAVEIVNALNSMKKEKKLDIKLKPKKFDINTFLKKYTDRKTEVTVYYVDEGSNDEEIVSIYKYVGRLTETDTGISHTDYTPTIITNRRSIILYNYNNRLFIDINDAQRKAEELAQKKIEYYSDKIKKVKIVRIFLCGYSN